jgi:hypothetical protein
MKLITTRQALTELARQLRVRDDWHEPDEQDLTARVEGVSFDNAGFWPTHEAGAARVEMHVILSKVTAYDDEGEPVTSEDVAAINLATLLAWASEPVSTAVITEETEVLRIRW